MIAMPKQEGHKNKLLILKDIFEKYTDEEHCLSVPEIVELLAEQEIEVERKTVYTDIKSLNEYGFEIQTQSRGQYNHIDRLFDITELKMLIDSVQSSRFITQKGSKEIIKKLETLCSQYEAQQLRRQVIVANRTKTDNTAVFRTLDALNRAISGNKKVMFRYFRRDRLKQKEYRHNGKHYEVSPFALVYTDDNYYLVGLETNGGKAKHYRVDRMESVRVLEEVREGHEKLTKEKLADYTKYTFSMYSGDIEHITLRFATYLVDTVLDRFGADTHLNSKGEDADHFTIDMDIAVSKTFYGWLCGLGEGVEIVSPQSVVNGYLEHLEGIKGRY